MVQVVCRIVPIMRTHWQRCDLKGEIAIRVPIDGYYLITGVEVIWEVVGENRLDLAQGISDAVILHLQVLRRLKVDILRAKQILQNCLEFNSFLAHDKDPQSSGSNADNRLPLWKFSISRP